MTVLSAALVADRCPYLHEGVLYYEILRKVDLQQLSVRIETEPQKSPPMGLCWTHSIESLRGKSPHKLPDWLS